MILVTGGAGYIGSHTVKLLLQRDYQVLVFDSLELGHVEALTGGTLIQGNLLNENDVESVFVGYPIQAVIHFAAYASV
ncbi:MAG: NAD-dependent epimerase/dehydratase family protein, partial [Armatimonadota bacterium]